MRRSGAVFAGSNSSVLASWALGSFGSYSTFACYLKSRLARRSRRSSDDFSPRFCYVESIQRFGVPKRPGHLDADTDVVSIFSYKPASLFQGLRDLVERKTRIRIPSRDRKREERRRPAGSALPKIELIEFS